MPQPRGGAGHGFPQHPRDGLGAAGAERRAGEPRGREGRGGVRNAWAAFRGSAGPGPGRARRKRRAPSRGFAGPRLGPAGRGVPLRAGCPTPPGLGTPRSRVRSRRCSPLKVGGALLFAREPRVCHVSLRVSPMGRVLTDGPRRLRAHLHGECFLFGRH